ncbi:MAG: uracil phosphoribosyltransferase [Ruminococcus sp.]|nr:uracil phosphoribosyltransferase [Ruminococcus sp.]MBD5145476.1 uracil phosphoribosyltransferase [Ruminococcus sp.]
MNNVTIIEHPLVQHKISLLRDINTGSKEFRELVSETAMLMCYEATRDLPLKTVEVQTPLAIAKTKVISGRKLAFVPILRAGLGMVDGAVQLVPAAKIGHVGIFRDPETKNAVQYYCKLPFDIAERDVIITDIMLATGGTAIKTIEILKNAGAKNIKMMCIITCPDGIEAVHKAYPEVEIYCGAVDEKLDEKLYIVPGMGDAGDRIFGTK